MMIRTDGSRFKDEHGRTLMLRGVNLGGSSKVPFKPNGATHLREHFYNHRDVSFVGRPFPINEAEEHFKRLKSWGMTFLRLLVTWEAVEHAGPGQYDQEYLHYLRTIVEIAGQSEIQLFIDPHQDVWSRFSGGDGAPGWTFEAIGLDITRFAETGAAITHQTHGDPFPRMIWPTNSGKLAAATMFTLFFGGNDFAPHVKVDGSPVQEYLQRHYINAMVEVAKALKGLSNVVGFDTMNEPLPGYIGISNLDAPIGVLKLGACPTPAQGMFLGAGHPQDVEVWRLDIRGNKAFEQIRVNPTGINCWLPGFDCVWRQHAVWDEDLDGEPRIMQSNYFGKVDGRTVDFASDYYRPFAARFCRAIREVLPEAILFLEPDPHGKEFAWSELDATNVVYAPHWYDGYVLMLKDYQPSLAFDSLRRHLVWGKRRIRRSFAEQLTYYKESARDNMSGVPTLIGEFGIALDLRGARAYRTGDFRLQIAALDRSCKAMEDNLLSYTLWNYTADNDNARGDQWNGEDLSIFSRDQQYDPDNIYSGGRALEAALRPYPMAVAGEPTHLEFNIRRKRFVFEFRHDPLLTAPTEIFLPNLHYPHGITVQLSDGTYAYQPERQMLIYRHDGAMQQHRIEIYP